MTRINVVAVEVLTDQHLMAEYRELPMVAGSLKRSLRGKSNWRDKIKPYYTLNSGHVTFFYNKGKYLKRRYDAIISELIFRGFKLDPNRRPDFTVFEDNNLNLDWKPTKQDLKINAERITLRINSKIDWYKWHGMPINSLNEELLKTIQTPERLFE